MKYFKITLFFIFIFIVAAVIFIFANNFKKLKENISEFSNNTAPTQLEKTDEFFESFSKTNQAPRGIYALDSLAGVYRDGNIRDYSFVTGYAWRMGWPSFEPEKDKYDFSSIDYILKKLEAKDKKLSLILISPDLKSPIEPGYLAENKDVLLWQYTDINPRHKNYNLTISRPVPWDKFTQDRFKLFSKNLAEHKIKNKKDEMITLRDHPSLAHIIAIIPGIGALREGGGGGTPKEISELPEYSREKLTEATITGLQSITSNFPDTPVSLMVFPITDQTNNPPLWEYITDKILLEFDGIKNPKVGFYMENLAAAKDAQGNIIGAPNISFAAPLKSASEKTFIGFQMLQPWSAPFSNPAKTVGTNPLDAMYYANENFGANYFEIYVNDLDNKDWWSLFERWKNN